MNSTAISHRLQLKYVAPPRSGGGNCVTQRQGNIYMYVDSNQADSLVIKRSV